MTTKYQHDHPYPNEILVFDSHEVPGIEVVPAGTRVQVTQWPEDSDNPEANAIAVVLKEPESEIVVEFYPELRELLGIHPAEGSRPGQVAPIIPVIPEGARVGKSEMSVDEETLSSAVTLAGAAQLVETGKDGLVELLVKTAKDVAEKVVEIATAE